MKVNFFRFDDMVENEILVSCHFRSFVLTAISRLWICERIDRAERFVASTVVTGRGMPSETAGKAEGTKTGSNSALCRTKVSCLSKGVKPVPFEQLVGNSRSYTP